jgi:hypothetical protein
VTEPADLPVVTVHVWDVTSTRVPAALWHVAVDRRQRPYGMTFGKLIGTGSGRTFTVRDADPHRWGLVAAWTSRSALAAAEQDSPLLAGWRGRAWRTSRLVLRTLSSRGQWAGRAPFPPCPDSSVEPWTGPVAALTRARLRLPAARRFWAAVPAVTAELRDTPGVRFALGIGEAPIGLQGTLSVWQDAAALRQFAYAGPAHRAVIARTPIEKWYAEELFARFAVLQADPLFRAEPVLDESSTDALSQVRPASG